MFQLVQGLRQSLTRFSLGTACAAAVLAVSVSWSQQVAPEMRVYPLRHAAVEEVAAKLRGILDSSPENPEIMVEHDRNRIVVRGSADIQRLVGQMIKTLDRQNSAGERTIKTPRPADVRGYNVPREELQRSAEIIRGRFPESTGVRVATDSRTSQILVVAPQSVHDALQLMQRSGELAQATDTGPVPERRIVQSPLRPGTVSLQNVSWRELQDAIQRSMRGRVNVATDRSGELATLTAREEDGQSATMQIDRRHNSAQINGNGDFARSWKQLARMLDAGPQLSNGTAEVVPINRADPNSVQQAIELLRSVGRDKPDVEVTGAVPVSRESHKRRWGGELVSMIFQRDQQEEDEVQEPEDAEATPTPAEEEVVGEEEAVEEEEEETTATIPANPEGVINDDLAGAGVMGPVQIEFVEGLGVFIIKGHKRDVERVRKIIEQIENQTRETKPEIEVFHLNHANSQAVAELVLSLYADVFGPRQSPVSVVGLGKPNAVLLIGLREGVDAVKELIVKLDKPVAPSSQIRVFRLLHMPALDAEQTVNNFYSGATTQQGGQGGGASQTTTGLSARVVAVADFRSNSLIVQASPRDMVEVAMLIQKLDVESTEAVTEVKVFKLQNALATDLQQVLQNAIAGQSTGGFQQTPGVQGLPAGAQGGGQGNLASTRLSIVGIDGAGNKVLNSGILNGAIVTADANVNALVVRAPSKSMPLIGELIRQLDQPPDAESIIKVFSLENGDAVQLTAMLQQLFGQQVTAGQGALGQLTQAISLSNLQPGAGAGESSLVPLRFSIDQRTNSIVASGTIGDLNVVEILLLRLDQGGIETRVTEVFRLKNAPAFDVATAIANFLAEQRAINNQLFITGEVSSFEQVDREVIVVPELVTNSLIISASPKYYPEIQKMVDALDFRPSMVMVQVVIAEVDLDDRFELGVELGLQDSMLFDRGIAAGETASSPGFNFNNLGLLPNASTSGQENFAGQALSSLTLGRASSTLGYGGLVLSAASESVNMLVRALQDEGRLQILSRPQIMTLDNEQAFVQVGQNTSRITGSTSNTVGGTTNTVEDVSIGLLLRIQPRINEDRVVVMTVDAENSALDDTGVPVAVDATGQPVISPNINITTASTTVSAHSGQTVVFAGLITKSRINATRKVPFLGDIPALGRLFRYDTETDNRSELLIFMTPHVIDSEDEMEQMNLNESDRMSWCLADVLEVNGEVDMMPGNGLWGPVQAPTVYPDIDPAGGTKIAPPQIPGNVDVEAVPVMPTTQRRPQHLNQHGVPGRSRGRAVQVRPISEIPHPPVYERQQTPPNVNVTGQPPRQEQATQRTATQPASYEQPVRLPATRRR